MMKLGRPKNDEADIVLYIQLRKSTRGKNGKMQHVESKNITAFPGNRSLDDIKEIISAALKAA